MKDGRDRSLALNKVQTVAQTFIQTFGLLNKVSIVRSGRQTRVNNLFCLCKSNSEQNFPTQISSLPVPKLNGARFRTNSTQVCCQLRTHNNPRLSRRRKAEPQAAAEAHVHSSYIPEQDELNARRRLQKRLVCVTPAWAQVNVCGRLVCFWGYRGRTHTQRALCAGMLHFFYICKCQYTNTNQQYGVKLFTLQN